MATYFPPKRGVEFITYVALESVATSGAFQSSATLSSGDCKISIDGGSLANLTTLPVVTPGSSKLIKVTVSAAEMTGDNIMLVFSDQSGNEWKDMVMTLATTARQIDDLATPTNITAGTITTATNVTTVNGLAAGVITAASIAADAITDAKVASDVTIASVTGAVGSVTGAVGSVTGNVGGNVAGSVASVTAGVTLADNAITAAKIATDAIDADAIAASAVTEIQNGLATLAGLFGYDLNGKTFEQAVIEIWATRVGGATRNSTSYPFTADYDGPDGTVEVSHVHASALSRTLD